MLNGFGDVMISSEALKPSAVSSSAVRGTELWGSDSDAGLRRESIGSSVVEEAWERTLWLSPALLAAEMLACGKHMREDERTSLLPIIYGKVVRLLQIQSDAIPGEVCLVLHGRRGRDVPEHVADIGLRVLGNPVERFM